MEHKKAEGMKAEYSAKPVTRLRQVCKTNNNKSGLQVFNLEESGVYVRNTDRLQTKAIFERGGRSNVFEL